MDIVETIPAVVSAVEKRFFAAVNARIEERVKQQSQWK
jgi:hypothetical protein